jgi:signal peptidase I
MEPTSVNGRSMLQALQPDDKVMVNKVIYHFQSPERGEVVVFHTEDGKDLIKRVIGVPGDTVEAKEGKVFVNGKPLPEPYLGKDVVTGDFPPVKVPNGKYFVLGDNRSESADSRILGLVSEEDIIGRASFIYFPFHHFGFVAH